MLPLLLLLLLLVMMMIMALWCQQNGDVIAGVTEAPVSS